MPLRNWNTVPPGGFRLTQKLPNGETKSYATMNDAGVLARQIADFRRGNGLPNATASEVLREIEEQTCSRLHNDPEYCVAVAEKKSPRPAVNRPLSARAGLVGSGAKVLVEWLGDGAVPVPIAQAQARANVCLTCPENRNGHKWLRLTADIVRTIAEQMQAKAAMKLRVESEERLHSCGVCLCPLALKIHVPLPAILAHTDNETLAAFPSTCWIPTERQSL